MKRTIIIISLLITSISAFLLYFFVFPKQLTIKSLDINLSPIAGQAEYIDIKKDRTRFLTYKETAVAEIDNNSGKIKILTDQIIYGTIYDFRWSVNQDFAIIKYVNDEYDLSEVKGFDSQIYKKDEYIFATLDINKGEVKIMPPGVQEVWMTENKILGLRDNNIVELQNNKWSQTTLKTTGNKVILSNNGECFALKKDNKLYIYIGLKLINEYEINNEDISRFRIFNNGYLSYVTPENIKIITNKKIKNININIEDRVSVGNDTLIYSSNNNYYLYRSSKNSYSRINSSYISNDNFDLTNLYGLSEWGAFFAETTNLEDNFTISLWSFRD